MADPLHCGSCKFATTDHDELERHIAKNHPRQARTLKDREDAAKQLNALVVEDPALLLDFLTPRQIAQLAENWNAGKEDRVNERIKQTAGALRLSTRKPRKTPRL